MTVEINTDVQNARIIIVTILICLYLAGSIVVDYIEERKEKANEQNS